MEALSKLDFKPLVVDWSKYAQKGKRGSYLLPEDGLPTEVKALYMPWTVEELEAVLVHLTVLTNIPIKCRGEACHFAHDCPLVHNDVVRRALDKNCPVEMVDAFKYLSGYVTDLAINPCDYTDLQMVNDLIRLQLMINRCDKFLQKEDPFEVIISGTDVKTSLEHRSRAPHALVQQQKLLRQDMDRIYQRLVAARDARNTEARASGKQSGMIHQIMEALETARRAKELEASGDVIESELVEDTTVEEINEQETFTNEDYSNSIDSG